jgi:hypothetical protein
VGGARLRRQAHLCGAHVVSNYAPLLDARLPGIQTRLDGLGSHARRRIHGDRVGWPFRSDSEIPGRFRNVARLSSDRLLTQLDLMQLGFGLQEARRRWSQSDGDKDIASPR